MPPVPQTTKKVSDVCLKTKSCDPSCFDVWATWDVGLHQHSDRGKRKRNRTHTDLVPRTNNVSDKPAGIPHKSANRTRHSNTRRFGDHKGPEWNCTSRFPQTFV
ncbi:hypothetical protein JOB18_007803 [Solea senegalensis]|uniref:Uncharacterized protein n=1 Tax=Solea senegalensis TaxID=28829 RepID=A0AAV6QGT7_SOLSE|nr:hypothetical protein JOB18_007803 [Solea senegalensis]